MLALVGSVSGIDSHADQSNKHPSFITIERAVNQTVSLLRAEPSPEKRKGVIRKQVYPLLIPLIDFKTFAKLVVAKNKKAFTPDQFKEFSQLTQERLLLVYGNAFQNFKDQKIKFKPYRKRANAKRSTVSFDIIQSNNEKTSVDFLMHNRVAGTWLVYDIRIESISLVASYRSQVDDLIAQNSIPALLELFRKKVTSGK